MRVVDAILAIPLIITALVAITAVGPSRKTLILVIGFVFTPIIAKTVRAAVLGEAQLEYVQAARLRNERGPYVMFAEILPNVTGPIIVEFTVRLGYAIFTVATLAFLGFAADPTVPDWGQDISAHYQSINARLLVAGALPLARHRDAHRRHQPDRGCDRAALRAMTDAAIELQDLQIAYTVRGVDRRVLRGVSFSRSGRASRTGSSGSPAAGRRRRRSRSCATSRATRRSQSGSIRLNGEDMLAMSGGNVRRLQATTLSMVYQNPASALNPSIRVGPQLAEVFELLGVSRSEEALHQSEAMLHKVQISDPTAGDAPLPAPALGRHAAARRHRDGPREEPDAPHPRRADDRPRRDGRGRGARPHRARSARSSGRASSSSATTSRSIAKMCERVGVLYAGRLVEEGARPGDLPGPAAPLHGRPPPLHPARRRAEGRDRAGHDPGLPPPARRRPCRAASSSRAAASPRRSAASRSPTSSRSATGARAAATSTTGRTSSQGSRRRGSRLRTHGERQSAARGRATGRRRSSRRARTSTHLSTSRWSSAPAKCSASSASPGSGKTTLARRPARPHRSADEGSSARASTANRSPAGEKRSNGAGALAPDRLPEPRRSAQPPPLGAANHRPRALQASRPARRRPGRADEPARRVGALRPVAPRARSLRSSPAASSSASQSRGRSRASRASSSATSPPRRSTSPCRRRSSTSSSSCRRRKA